MTDRQHPHDVASERGLIGSILIDPDLLKTIEIESNDFHIHRHRFIWEAFKNISERDEPIDFITLGAELKDKDVDMPYITSLINETPSSCNVQAYAKTVKNYSAKRSMINIFSSGVNACLNGKDPNEIRTSVELELNKVSAVNKVDDHVYDAPMAGKLALNATENASRGDRAFKYGINDLDDLLWVSKRDLVIVGGRPGTGKTILLITGLANNPNKRGLLFEMETGIEQATQRVLSQIANIPAYRIVRGKLQEDEIQPYFNAVAEFEKWQTVICDLPAMKLSQIKRIARKEHAKKPLDFILVDYLQLTNGENQKENRNQQLEAIAYGLKDLAKELDIPIIAAAQINRGSELTSEKKPQLHQLRDSGAIEQAADSVVFVHPTDTGRLLIVAKQRMGKLGEVNVYFNEEIMKFSDANVHTVNFNNYPD